MADGFAEINPGTLGAKVKGDTDASGHFWQYVKAAWGGSGTQKHVDDVAGNRLPMAAREGLASTVPVTFTQNVTASAVALTANACRTQRLENIGTGSVFIGPSGVTVATGYRLLPGQVFPPSGRLEFDNFNRIFVIAAQGHTAEEPRQVQCFGEV